MKGGEGGVQGLVRLVQTSPDQCVVEGTIDGLRPVDRHAVCVHKYGDFSDGLKRWEEGRREGGKEGGRKKRRKEGGYGQWRGKPCLQEYYSV